MARQRFDISSKWLLQNQGKSTLLVGGLRGIDRCEPMPGEVIQNRRYPDGLLQAFLRNDSRPHHVLVEIATYPERRALKQAVDDLTLAYSALGHLPDLLMLVLRPKGKFRIDGEHAVQSELGTAQLKATWRVVELWTLPAEQFLAEGDVGIMPWVPLMQMNGAPEPILERCAKRIEREAKPKQVEDMLAISQVLTELRFANAGLLSIFGGEKIMIESPLLQKIVAAAHQGDILEVLKDRFGAIPRDVVKLLTLVSNEKQLKKLLVLATKCPDLERFREALKA